MGIFDRLFKKKESETHTNNNSNQLRKDYEIAYKYTKEGRLQIDFIEDRPKNGQFYDTTRLVVDNTPYIIEDEKVQNCRVSWYSQDDCVLLEPQYNGESINARDYKSVLAQLDMNLLTTDERYCAMVMKGLLNKNRVTRYLEEGLKDAPERPCGNYIGEVRKTDTGYGKFFVRDIGQAVHNSESMKRQRREHQEQMEKSRQRQINSRQAQIQKLQDEINELER